jgi:hypothetical protein
MTMGLKTLRSGPPGGQIISNDLAAMMTGDEDMNTIPKW